MYLDLNSPHYRLSVKDGYSTTSIVNQTINFGVYAQSSLGETLAYSAAGLPPGLSIDSQTGVISGTVLRAAALPSVFQVSITATAASDSDTTTFLWTVLSSYQQNVITLPSPTGVGTFDIMSPDGTQLTASISPDAGVALPVGVEFPYDFLTFTISFLEPGQAADLTISGLDLSGIEDYFKYGATPANPTEHWYNFLFGIATDGDSALGTGMEIVGDTLVLHLIDGGRGDDDLAMNGVIFDIGGPAVTNFTPPVLLGDYNQSGTVDSADYTLWRDQLGQTGLTPFSGADGNGNGAIDAADYEVWKANFGATLPPGAGGSGAAAVAFAELALDADEPVVPLSVTTIAQAFTAEADANRAIDSRLFAGGFTRHSSTSRLSMWTRNPRVTSPTSDNLLLVLAVDRINVSARRGFAEVDDSMGEDRRNYSMDSMESIIEPIALALREWR